MLRTESIARFAAAIAASALVSFGTLASRRAQAPVPILIEGLTDWEYWSTTANSNLLTRNAGRWEGVGRAQLWGAIEPLRGLVFYGQGELEGYGVNARLENEGSTRPPISTVFATSRAAGS